MRMSSSRQAIDMLTYSKGPIHSVPPTSKLLTGLTNLAIELDKKIPGKNLFFCILFKFDCSLVPSSTSSSTIDVSGRYATSRVVGTVP